MPWELPILNFRRTYVDAEHVWDLSTTILSFATGQPFVVSMAQSGNQFLAQLTHGLGIDAVVDGFVRHA